MSKNHEDEYPPNADDARFWGLAPSDEPLLTNDEIERLIKLARHAASSRPPNCEYIHAAALNDLDAFLALHDDIA